MNTATEKTIKNYSLMAAGGGLIPIPIIDFIAVSGIQMDLVQTLCEFYGVDFYKHQGKSVISALVGTTLANIGSSFIKAIPGLGSILGGVSMSILSGASTYAIGQVFARHFEQGGTMDDLDIDDFKNFYNQQLEEGKQLVKTWREKDEQPESTDPRQVILNEKLANLKRLFEQGIITEKEHETLRKRAFDDFLDKR